MNAGLLDSIPLFVVTALFAIISFAFYEIGFRVGRWWQERMPGEQEGPTDVLIGSLLAEVTGSNPVGCANTGNKNAQN